MAKQTLEVEKKEMLRRIEELEANLNVIKNENGEKEKLIRSHKLHLEDFVKKQSNGQSMLSLVN